MEKKYLKPQVKMLRVAQENLMVIVSGTEIDPKNFEEGAKEQFSDESDQITGSSVWED